MKIIYMGRKEIAEYKAVQNEGIALLWSKQSAGDFVFLPLDV